MTNLIEFIRGFLSYGLLFLIAVVLCIVAVLLGIRLRKQKDAKDALAAEAAEAEQAG